MTLIGTVRHPLCEILFFFFPLNKVTQGPGDNDVSLYDNDGAFKSKSSS